jgi:bifunctional UDP-N-acetylglucosamine pyrophosphorylase/glucosamine-1-phosphate N-acetyltransferase
MRKSLAVVLAAGEGKRMKSHLPKVLHPIGGLPMLFHVLNAIEPSVDRMVVVASPSSKEAISAAVGKLYGNAEVVVQAEQRGTGHALLVARDAFADADDILVVFGDTPFISPQSIELMRAKLAEGASVVAAGMRPAEPAGYGRLIMQGDQLVAIREERDANDSERAIGFCNSGLMALAGDSVLDVLDEIEDDNDQGELYLTDAVEIAHRRGLKVQAVEIAADEALGINDRAQLAEAERLFQSRRRAELMVAGVTLIAPETVFLAYDTTLSRDVVVEPNVVFGPGVSVAESVTIRAFSHLEGASIASGAIVGPFARLRPGASIGEGAHVGNFVEIKQATLGAGAKANHLTYIGDASIGAGSNIGAGTITCNYDGVSKFRTEIGEGVFVGSNSALVAPISIGNGAYIATGSVITDEVEADTLAFGRARQVNKPGRAAKLRRKQGGS